MLKTHLRERNRDQKQPNLQLGNRTTSRMRGRLQILWRPGCQGRRDAKRGGARRPQPSEPGPGPVGASAARGRRRGKMPSAQAQCDPSGLPGPGPAARGIRGSKLRPRGPLTGRAQAGPGPFFQASRGAPGRRRRGRPNRACEVDLRLPPSRAGPLPAASAPRRTGKRLSRARIEQPAPTPRLFSGSCG